MAINKGKLIIIVMLITILSKCFGFLRDMTLAYFFGAGSVTDAYLVSQIIPEFLFSLVVQTVAIGFIPIYMDVFNKESKQKAFLLTDNLLILCLLLCCVLTVLVNVFAKEVVWIFASGFEGQTAQIAVTFVRIAVLAMFFRITTSIYSAFLQANDEFVAPAAVGLPFDIIIILSIFIGFHTNPSLLAWGIVIASASQFLFILPSVIKRKPHFSFSELSLFNPHIAQMMKLFLPVALGVGANQINILVDRTLASAIEGGISALNYANKVNNVIENIVILSLAAVMFPAFSNYVSKDNIKSFTQSVAKSLNIVIIVMLPCTVFIFLFSQEVISFLFGRGAFDQKAAFLTASAMRYYSLGLLFLSFNIVLTRAFYALHKVKLVSLVACAAMAVNVVLNIYLSSFMGVAGLALATSIANACSALILFLFLIKKTGSALWLDIRGDLGKCFMLTILIGFFANRVYNLLNLHMAYWLACGGAVLAAGGLYFALCLTIKCQGIKYITALALGLKQKYLSEKNKI